MRKIGFLIVSAAFCHGALADVTYRADLGVGYSDNIRRIDVDPIDEKIGVVGLELSWLQKTVRLDADVKVGGDYMHYVDGTFDNEFVGLAGGAVTIGIAPEHFTWLFQDSFGQAQSDPFAPATPETRENINYFTTGPDFIVNLGAANSVRVFGRYSLTNYELTPFDGDRTGGGLILARRLAGQNSISLQGVQEAVRFDDMPSSDFDRRNLFVNLELVGARTEMVVDLGYSWITLQDETEIAGPLARVDITRKLSPSNTVILSFGDEFSDASTALRGAVDGGMAGDPTGVTSAPAPFENRFAEFSWNFNRNRTGFGLRASWNHDDYDPVVLIPATGVTPPADRTRIVFDMTFSRRLTATFSVSLFGSYIEEEFETQATSEELRGGGAFDWQFGRHVGLSLSAEHDVRTTSNGLSEYSETRGFLTLFYRSAEATGR